MPRASLAVLFSRAVIRRTLLGSLITVTINVVLYGLLSWLPTFLVIERLGVSESLRYTMLMSLGAPVGPLIACFLSDRTGRRTNLAVASVLSAALGAAYAMVPSIEAATVVGFFLFLSLYLLVALGLAYYVPELFPTAYRMRGAGVCMTAVAARRPRSYPYLRFGLINAAESVLIPGSLLRSSFSAGTGSASIRDRYGKPALGRTRAGTDVY